MKTSTGSQHGSFRLKLAAAIAGPALSLLAGSSANAQYLVPQDGSARDANNRVGSNGRHYGPSPRSGSTVTANQIVNGNVNRGQYFRGPTASTDARAFRGNTSTNVSDRFLSDSSGGYDRQTFAEAFVTRPFYGESRAVAAPVGYRSPVSTVGNSYTQSPLYAQPLNAASLASLNTGENILPRLGTTTTILGGPAEGRTGASSSYLVMSPLSGIRTVSPEQLPSYMIRSELQPSGGQGDRFGTNSPFLDRVRTEMGDPGEVNPNAPAPVPGTPSNQPKMGPQPLNQPLQPPVESPNNAPLSSGANAPQPGGAGPQPLQSGVNTGQSIRRQYTVQTKSNEVYSELEKRLRSAQGGAPKTDQQAQEDFRNLKPVRPADGAGTRPAAPGLPGALDVPIAPSAPAAPSGGNPEPLELKTLSDGQKSATLAKHLRDAEADMKQGKFADAITKYAQAEEAVPNDPMIALGRANAELGASNYRTAEAQLRQAFGGSPALLMGKYDLNALIGQDRLTKVSAELADLAQKEPQETMATFLLAYISYNTGKEADAAKHLNEVARREGTPDPIVKAMLEKWKLPASDGNK